MELNSEIIISAADSYEDSGMNQVAQLIKAMAVIILTPGIRAHLVATDPMALEQAEAAMARICPAR